MFRKRGVYWFMFRQFLKLLCGLLMSGLATDQLVTAVEDKLAGLDSYEELLAGIAQGGGVAAL